MSILRITVIRLKETPKFLVGEGKDEQVVETLQGLAMKYNRPCSLTLAKLQACNQLAVDDGRRTSVSAHAKRRVSLAEIWGHLRGLFVTRRIALSTSLIWFSWLLIGLVSLRTNVIQIHPALTGHCRLTRSTTFSSQPTSQPEAPSSAKTHHTSPGVTTPSSTYAVSLALFLRDSCAPVDFSGDVVGR